MAACKSSESSPIRFHESLGYAGNIFNLFKEMKIDRHRYQPELEKQSKDMVAPSTTACKDYKKEQATEMDDFSESLRNFCFCDKNAIGLKGEKRWKASCRFHQLFVKRRKDNIKAAGKCKNLNLSVAAEKYKPLLQKSRLKLTDDEKPYSLVQPARFNFTYSATKPNETRTGNSLQPTEHIAERSFGKSGGSAAVAASPTVSTFSGTNRLKQCECVKKGNGVKAGIMSAPESTCSCGVSNSMPSFCSLLPVSDKPSSEEKESFPKFEGHRFNIDSHHSDDWPQATASSPSKVDTTSPVPARSDEPEERLGEFNAIDLAAYMEHYFCLRTDTSFAAKCMYT